MKALVPLPLATAHGHTTEEPKGKGERNGETYCPYCQGYFVRIPKDKK